MTRRGIGSYDEDDADTRSISKESVEVSLFVHKVLPKSLLCSEHGRRDTINGELVGGKVIPWSLIEWPDAQLRKFRNFELIASPRPEVFNFQLPQWFAKKSGLI